MLDGWKSIEEIDRRGDFILATHDPAVLEHSVYPYEGMPLRKKREVMPGLPFYFGGI
jgi:hypothetical protein